MAKKYILKSHSGPGTERSRPLDEFTEADFSRYQETGLSESEEDDLQQQAIEDQYFEWWIEEGEE